MRSNVPSLTPVLAAAAALAAAALAAACSPEVRDLVGAGGSSGASGSHTSSGAPSSTSSGSTASSASSGAGGTGGAACTPETDSALCMTVANACETPTLVDNCGTSRTPNCGECNAPLACVASTCATPECTSFTFTSTGTEVSGANVAGEQDIPESVTPSGGSILVLQGSPCGPTYIPAIADETAPSSLSYTLLPVTAPAGMDLAGEEQACLTSDGLTIIGLTTAHTGFVASTRSAVGMSDFGAVDATAFANVVATGTQTLSHPSISSDGLAFYYNVSGDPSASVNGIYEALRTTPTGVFAAGVLMNATIQGYQCVTGQSADRMTLFLQDANFRTWVLTRTSVLQQFVNPNAPAAPPFVPGFRIQPITGCTTLIGTCNSGCSNEKVCSY